MHLGVNDELVLAVELLATRRTLELRLLPAFVPQVPEQVPSSVVHFVATLARKRADQRVVPVTDSVVVA